MLYALLYSTGWFLYSYYITPFASRSIDPCSGTPGLDNTLAIIILPVYIALFGFMTYRLSRCYLPTLFSLLAAVFIVLVLPLLLMFALILFFDKDDIRAWITGKDLFSVCYTYGCYQDIEMNANLLLLLTTLLLYIFLCLYFLLIHKLRILRKTNP